MATTIVGLYRTEADVERVTEELSSAYRLEAVRDSRLAGLDDYDVGRPDLAAALRDRRVPMRLNCPPELTLVELVPEHEAGVLAHDPPAPEPPIA